MIKINPQDIIGKVFGTQEVIEYVGKKYLEKYERYEYYYKVKCTQCGSESIRKRCKIRSAKNQQFIGCNHCCESRKEVMRMCREKYGLDNLKKLSSETAPMKNEKKFHSKKPSVTNVSTGIKHYFINRMHNGAYRHVVVVLVDGTKYFLYNHAYKDLPEHPVKEIVEIAEEVNDVLAAGGSKGFLKWYEENYKN